MIAEVVMFALEVGPELATNSHTDAGPKLVIAGGKADESATCGPLITQLRASNRCGRDARSLPTAEVSPPLTDPPS